MQLCQKVIIICVCLLWHGASGKLLTILLDGFRWDYFNQRQDLSGFQKIFQEGVRVKHLVPAFPTVSYTNYYTLFTGLYAESHGFVGNKFYDTSTNKTYSPSFSLTNEERSFMYDEAEPLWITAVKQNKRVYMFHYVDCDVTIRGRIPTFCLKYDGVPTPQDFRQSLDTSLELFANSSADLSVVYYESVDDSGHRYGPLTSMQSDAVKTVDSEIDRMLTKLTEKGLDNAVDVMIFSDHGMATVSPTQVVNITGTVDMSLVEQMIGYDSFAFIWPKEGKLEQISSSLTNFNPNMDLYSKDNIPAMWHFQNHRRIPPLLVTTKTPWYLETPVYRYYYYTDTGDQLGSHGFDNQDPLMHGFFAGIGKNFNKGKTTGSLESVNLYQIMCRLLDIKPQQHNGSWSHVSHMIATVSGGEGHVMSCILLVSTLAAVAAVPW